jgi:fumarate hydratase class II
MGAVGVTETVGKGVTEIVGRGVVGTDGVGYAVGDCGVDGCGVGGAGVTDGYGAEGLGSGYVGPGCDGCGAVGVDGPADGDIVGAGGVAAGPPVAASTVAVVPTSAAATTAPPIAAADTGLPNARNRLAPACMCVTLRLGAARAGRRVTAVHAPRRHRVAPAPPTRRCPAGARMAGMSEDYRIEHDSMGEVRVPAAAKWRAQTQRAVENFPISGMPLERAHIAALARIKAAAARVNAELGVLPADLAAAIADAAEEVAAGRWDGQFPVDVFQTGSGTSSNMNANEVIATLAEDRLGRAVHPNDHVNASQSSNDVFPSSIHLAAVAAVVGELIPALELLATSLEAKSAEFAEVVKSGRTHLMDATPVTLGQEFGGYAAAVRYGVERLRAALPRLAELPLGGTAVGTGINTPAGFAAGVIADLARVTGLPLTEARNHFEAQGARDALVETSGQLRTVAVSLTKIANDLRWMASGPRTGLAEIALPDLQPGSSIMPGKVNPVLCEAVCMVAAQVIGNDATIAFAGASGAFELNVTLPLLGKNLLESIRLLGAVSRVFARRCVDGITADAERCREYAESSPSVVTPLNRYLGYEETARVAKQALAERRTIREVVVARGHVESGALTEAQLDAALDVLAMTRPPT